jgi:GGDEF domain-containing protein
MSLFRRLAPYLLPVAFLAGLSILLAVRPELPSAWIDRAAFRYLSYGGFLLAGLLGWRFNQAKFLFLGILLGSFQAVIVHGITAGLPIRETVVAGAVLLPVNFAAFYLLRERGLCNGYGLRRLLAVLLQAGALLLIIHYPAFSPTHWLPPGLWAMAGGQSLPIPRLAGVLFLLAFLLFLTVPQKYEQRLGSLLACALLAVLAALLCLQPDFVLWPDQWSADERELYGLADFILFMAATAILFIYAVLELSYGSAFVDQLTQLPSRRALDHRLSTLGSTYCIAMVDIDHFKKINDRHGHDTGDQALRFLASRLRAFSQGTAFRYGGEEFAIVMPRRRKNKAIPFLEALREDIYNATFYARVGERSGGRKARRKRGKSAPDPGRHVPLSVSIGVADCVKRNVIPSEVIIAADKALYRAKKKGRNRVEAARG